MFHSETESGGERGNVGGTLVLAERARLACIIGCGVNVTQELSVI